MPSAFDEIFTEAYEVDAAVFGVSVTLRRANSAAQTATAIVSATQFEVIGSDGALTVINGREYTIAKADYKIAERVTDPIEGDIITEGTVRREVFSIAGLPAFQEEHGDDTRWIIRTKKVQ